jgi:hypothetical protein
MRRKRSSTRDNTQNYPAHDYDPASGRHRDADADTASIAAQARY